MILGGIAVSSVTRVFIAAEDSQHRRAQVPRRAQQPDHGRSTSCRCWRWAWPAACWASLLARATLAAIPLALGGSTSILAEADYGLSWSAAAQGVAVGMLVSLLFSVVPLMQVRHVKPSLLLRDESARRERDWTKMAVMALVGLALIGVAGWQAGSLRVGARRLLRLRRAGRSCCRWPAGC